MSLYDIIRLDGEVSETTEDVTAQENATQEDLDAQEENAESWPEQLKTCIIILKVFIISLLLAIAIVKYQRKHRGFSMISVYLGLNISAMIGLLILDLTTKYIWLFFVLTFTANYVNFSALVYLLTNIPTREAEAMKNRLQTYRIVMNCLYIVTAFAAFEPTFGPFCRQDKLYPYVMNWSAALFLINMFYHHYLHRNDYFLKWEEKLITDQDGREHDEKDIFTKQASTFICFQTVVGVVQVIVTLLGRYSLHHADVKFLSCDNDGYEWVYTNIWGSLFCTGHIMVVLMQSVMMEKVFYGVPHHAGYFEAKEEPEAKQVSVN